jgi:hypothetical protein
MVQPSVTWSARLVAALSISFALAGCATTPPKAEAPSRSPEEMLRAVCSVGESVKGARGFVMVSAKSPDASGRFPATVDAKAEPATLRLEVTNLAGGTEALISIDRDRYEIRVPGRKRRTERGYGQWGGIPLRWANALFLGRVPCPAPTATDELRLGTDAQGRLVVDQPPALGRDAERFTYSFAERDGRLWPEHLSWERRGVFAREVEFRFHEPEPGTASPRRWEAKSREGEVKVRWSERRTDRDGNA